MKFKMSENSLFAILLRSPWWISLSVAAGIFVAVTLALPGPYAVFVALPFIVIGGYAALRQLRAPSEARVADTLAKLRDMSWADFSASLESAFRREGYTVQRLGGTQADFELTKAHRVTLVSGKRWKVARSGIEPLRELYAARRARDAHGCIFVSTGELSDNARAFAAEKNIRVVQDAELVKLLRGVGRARQNSS